MATNDDLTANIAKATGNPAPVPTTKPAPKKAAESPAKPPIKKGDMVGYKPDGTAVVIAPAIRPGTPCQRKGCPGRYSILQTRKVANQMVNDLICRTCQTKPAK
jgi:hypothetical protein